MFPFRAVGFLVLLASAGCYDHRSHASVASCDDRQAKAEVLAHVRQHYLWNTELSSDQNPDDCSDPKTLLSKLTAPARLQGKDRGFSIISTIEGSADLMNTIQAVGFGSQYGLRDGRVFICQAILGTGAAQAGLGRGDELIAFASTRPGLDAPANQAPALLASGALWGSLEAESRPAITGFFRIRKAATGAVVDVAASTSRFPIEPVPDAAAPAIFEPGGGHKVGYFMLRQFIKLAEEQLRQVMGRFRQAGVTDLIVDFRYNSGGRLDVMGVLLNLLGRDRATGDVMYTMEFNPDRSSENRKEYFQPEANALAPGRIAFIVTDTTASASETVVNALQPYYGGSLALIGGRTRGKPVGQLPFINRSCGWVLWLVAFQVRNARGHGDFFQGLPDQHFTGTTMAIQDDLDHVPGSPAEACTAAALRWIATGIASGPPIPGPAAARPPEPQGPRAPGPC